MIKTCTAEFTEAEEENEHIENKEEIIHSFEHRIDTVEIKRDTQEQMTYLGSTNVMINIAQLAKCNYSSISKLTCDLLILLFTRDELSGSSLTAYVMLKFGDVTNVETTIYSRR